MEEKNNLMGTKTDLFNQQIPKIGLAKEIKMALGKHGGRPVNTTD